MGEMPISDAAYATMEANSAHQKAQEHERRILILETRVSELEKNSSRLSAIVQNIVTALRNVHREWIGFFGE